MVVESTGRCTQKVLESNAKTLSLFCVHCAPREQDNIAVKVNLTRWLVNFWLTADFGFTADYCDLWLHRGCTLG